MATQTSVMIYSIENQYAARSSCEAPKRKRGRPLGSKNKPKTLLLKTAAVKKRRGSPSASLKAQQTLPTPHVDLAHLRTVPLGSTPAIMEAFWRNLTPEEREFWTMDENVTSPRPLKPATQHDALDRVFQDHLNYRSPPTDTCATMTDTQLSTDSLDALEYSQRFIVPEITEGSATSTRALRPQVAGPFWQLREDLTTLHWLENASHESPEAHAPSTAALYPQTSASSEHFNEGFGDWHNLTHVEESVGRPAGHLNHFD